MTDILSQQQNIQIKPNLWIFLSQEERKKMLVSVNSNTHLKYWISETGKQNNIQLPICKPQLSYRLSHYGFRLRSVMKKHSLNVTPAARRRNTTA